MSRLMVRDKADAPSARGAALAIAADAMLGMVTMLAFVSRPPAMSYFLPAKRVE